jgi:hypothetical protein
MSGGIASFVPTAVRRFGKSAGNSYVEDALLGDDDPSAAAQRSTSEAEVSESSSIISCENRIILSVHTYQPWPRPRPWRSVRAARLGVSL